MPVSPELRAAHQHFMDRPEWKRREEWRAIRDDDVWAEAYLPYDDEPLRTTGESITHNRTPTDLLSRRLFHNVLPTS